MEPLLLLISGGAAVGAGPIVPFCAMVNISRPPSDFIRLITPKGGGGCLKRKPNENLLLFCINYCCKFIVLLLQISPIPALHKVLNKRGVSFCVGHRERAVSFGPGK